MGFGLVLVGLTQVNLWKPIDWLGNWLGNFLTAKNQLRLGIICVLVSLPLAGYGPFSGEQLLIYEMSALALTLTGVGLVLTAVLLLKQDEQNKP